MSGVSYLVLHVGLLQSLVAVAAVSVAGPDGLEQAPSPGHGGEGSDEGGAGAATQKGDLGGVAAKVLDVQLDPLK